MRVQRLYLERAKSTHPWKTTEKRPKVNKQNLRSLNLKWAKWHTSLENNNLIIRLIMPKPAKNCFLSILPPLYKKKQPLILKHYTFSQGKRVFPLPFFTRFPPVRPSLPLISAPTGFHDCQLVTRRAQLLITMMQLLLVSGSFHSCVHFALNIDLLGNTD